MGHGVRIGKAAAETLCVFRTGSETVFPRAESHRGIVPRGARPVCGGNQARCGADLASGREIFPYREKQTTKKPKQPQTENTQKQARRRLDGRCARSPAVA